MRNSQLFALFTILFLSASPFTHAREFSLMTYNVENLFDTTHDVDKDDWTYLPRKVKYDPNSRLGIAALDNCYSLFNQHYKKECLELDWNERTLIQKMENLAAVISSYENGGPDVLVLQEVENLQVLQKFNEVSKLHYPTVVLIEGHDKRGIDVGLLSRFPLFKEPKIHRIDFSKLREKGINQKESRPILEVILKIEERAIAFLVNHWPSQGGKDDARIEAAKTLMDAASKIQDYPVIAIGDFNTLPSNAENGLTQVLTNTSYRHHFVDAHDMASHPVEASYWYFGERNYLDKIFFGNLNICAKASRNCPNKSKILPLWETLAAHKPAFAVGPRKYTEKGSKRELIDQDVPLKFNPTENTGASDHLPVVMKVSY